MIARRRAATPAQKMLNRIAAKWTRHYARVIRYLGVADVALWLGVEHDTVRRWLRRHDDFPEPDVAIASERGDIVGWRPEREQEIRDWYAKRQARSGPRGGRPRWQRPENSGSRGDTDGGEDRG